MGRVAACGLMLALMLAGVGRNAESQNVTQRGIRPELARGAIRPAAARVPGTAQSETAPTVEVTFQVQQPVLGAVGATYTLREWSGLWTGGRQRYRLGQRAMMFLHAAKGNGLSSPVDGMDGVVPVVVQGADTGALLDIRWLAARVQRAVGAPLADADTGAITLADGVAVAAGWKNAALPEPVQEPLPVGVRPVQTVQSVPPVQSVGVAGPPRPQPVVARPFGLPLEPAAVLKANGVHDMVQAAVPGGLDAIR
jgi:hypothetical protein